MKTTEIMFNTAFYDIMGAVWENTPVSIQITINAETKISDSVLKKLKNSIITQYEKMVLYYSDTPEMVTRISPSFKKFIDWDGNTSKREAILNSITKHVSEFFNKNRYGKITQYAVKISFENGETLSANTELQ